MGELIITLESAEINKSYRIDNKNKYDNMVPEVLSLFKGRMKIILQNKKRALHKQRLPKRNFR